MRFLVFLLVVCYSSYAQDYGIGTWKSHLPINKAIGLQQSNDEIFCASSSGLIVLDKKSSEKSILTKSEGLSDVDITAICFNELTNELIIGYNSGGIDIYKNGIIKSVFDIVRSSIVGSKSINKIKEIDGLLYICSDFGIVVFDPVRSEVKDTYFIAENTVSVNNVINYNDSIYAATKSGVYAASKNAVLSNKENWKKQNLPISSGDYSSIFVFNQQLFTNLNVSNYYSDTVYFYSENEWIKAPILVGHRNKSFHHREDQLVIANDYGVSIYDKDLNRVKYIYQYTSEQGMEPAEVIIDDANLSTLWCADKKVGLVKNKNVWTSTLFNYETPISANVNKIETSGGKIWMASGGVSGSQWQNVWLTDGIANYDGFDWNIINKSSIQALDTVFDYLDVAIDPTDRDHVFVASLGDGLLEFNDNELVNIYNEKNSSLQFVESASSNWHWVGVTGTSYDNQGNLWTANHSVEKILSVYDENGDWHGLDMRPFTQNFITGDILVTSGNQTWLTFPKSQGILIYEANGTFEDVSDDNGVVLTQNYGLSSNTVYAVAEDNDGEIWIGTDKGISVVYSPQSIFTGEGLEAKQILIEQDGYTEYLLENNSVTAIAVDGANRKWVGTRTSGVFLLSEDGSEELLHFTKGGSPLPSDEIKTIAVNHLTGEVYFGTEKGIVSYRAEATLGGAQYNNVNVFPNPVRENYSGPIAIKGLAENSNVKITDVSGSLVYETSSYGGQAIWYGKNMQGKRASTGVYLVFSSNNDGSESFVAKIMFVN